MIHAAPGPGNRGASWVNPSSGQSHWTHTQTDLLHEGKREVRETGSKRCESYVYAKQVARTARPQGATRIEYDRLDNDK